MPKGGLEPPRISSYAPETHVSTIPPLRQIENYYLIIKTNLVLTKYKLG